MEASSGDEAVTIGEEGDEPLVDPGPVSTITHFVVGFLAAGVYTEMGGGRGGGGGGGCLKYPPPPSAYDEMGPLQINSSTKARIRIVDAFIITMLPG